VLEPVMRIIPTAIVAAFAAFAVSLCAPPPGALALDNRGDRYDYVVDGGTSVEPTDSRMRSHATPVGRPAVLGHFELRPTGSSFTIFVNDVGTPDGYAVPVQIYTGRRKLSLGCVPVREWVTIRGVSPGQSVWVYMGYDRAGFGCTTRATAGVVTVRGATNGAPR
jgi:hypothetical protein